MWEIPQRLFPGRLVIMSFTSLGLSKDLLQAIELAGYSTPTAVQRQTIPLVLKGQDVIAKARTGTGKTASFALPILQLLQNTPNEEKRTIKALVLTPTRELAMQVNTAFKVYGRNLSKQLRTVLLVGGLNIDLQIRNLHHGADIAVVTPGRLLDLVLRQQINFRSLKVLVIDEADKMFDLGFAKELESVLNLLPQARQNLLFSATIGDKVTGLAKAFMPNAVSLKVDDDTPSFEKVHQRAIEVNRTNRGPLLRHLIKTEKWEHVLIFVASVRGADILAAKLRAAEIDAEAFHAGLTQAQRTQTLHDFKQKKINVLVATDIAARGIDIDKLSVVVNYDLPRSTEDYIHRIGRTARAGATGTAVSFIGLEDVAHFSLIEKRTQIRLPKESIKGFERVGEIIQNEKGALPVKGLRMSKKDKARALAARKTGQDG